MTCIISNDKESNIINKEVISELKKSIHLINNVLEENMLIQINTSEKSKIIFEEKHDYYCHTCADNVSYKLQKNTPYIFTSILSLVYDLYFSLFI